MLERTLKRPLEPIRLTPEVDFMLLRLVALLAPLGAALTIAFSSFTAHAILMEMGETMRSQGNIQIPAGHELGLLGLILVGLGVVATTLTSRPNHRGKTAPTIVGIIALLVAASLIGYGTWQLKSTLYDVATSPSLDADQFVRNTVSAKTPLLIGWWMMFFGCFLAFTMRVVGGGNVPVRQPAQRSNGAVTFALLALIAFASSSLWSFSSLNIVRAGLSETQIHPATLAGGLNGLMLSTYLAVFGIVCCAWAATLDLLVIASTEQTDDQVAAETLRQ